MKIAIIGTGISGLVAASRLHHNHDIDVFEANDYVGGHTNTIDVDDGGRTLGVDTGFIVFNDRTYPNFIELLDQLGGGYQPTTMGFAVRADRDNLEYCGSSIAALFAQKRNLFRPQFHRMLAGIIRFNRDAVRDAETLTDDTSLGEYLARAHYPDRFVDHYVVPMGAAIWSTDPRRILDFPARTFIRFFANHGLLSINDRPQWYVVEGGSKRYVQKLIAPFGDRIHLNRPVVRVQRLGMQVRVTTADGEHRLYDKAVIAAHSDQALKLLSPATPAELEILGAIRYQPNEAVLHTDTSLLPRRRRAWAAWNYHLPDNPNGSVTLTYNMNMLQSLEASKTYCVTLNNTAAIEPSSIIRTIGYDHPVFDARAVQAQQRWHEISGVDNIHYCGAYWGYGFHEDGVVSALRVVRALEQEHSNEKLLIRRAS